MARNNAELFSCHTDTRTHTPQHFAHTHIHSLISIWKRAPLPSIIILYHCISRSRRRSLVLFVWLFGPLARSLGPSSSPTSTPTTTPAPSPAPASSIINGSFGPTVQEPLADFFFNVFVFFFFLFFRLQLWHAENFMTSFADHQESSSSSLPKNWIPQRLADCFIIGAVDAVDLGTLQYAEFHAAVTIDTKDSLNFDQIFDWVGFTKDAN